MAQSPLMTISLLKSTSLRSCLVSRLSHIACAVTIRQHDPSQWWHRHRRPLLYGHAPAERPTDVEDALVPGDTRARLIVRSLTSAWSSPLDLDSVGSSGVVHVAAQQRASLDVTLDAGIQDSAGASVVVEPLSLAVSVRAGPPALVGRTRIITVAARTVIVNALKMPVLFCHADVAAVPCTVAPRTSAPYHAPRNSADAQRLSFSLGAEWVWTPPVDTTVVGSSLLKVRRLGGALAVRNVAAYADSSSQAASVADDDDVVLLAVSVTLDGATAVVSVTAATHALLPYRIENHTRAPMSISQKGALVCEVDCCA